MAKFSKTVTTKHGEIEIFHDASGAPAVLRYRGFVFAFNMLGVMTRHGIGGKGSRVAHKVALAVCTKRYLEMVAEATDDAWRAANVAMYSEASS